MDGRADGECHRGILRTSLIEGSLEAKLPTIWTDEAQPRRNSDVEKVRREKITDGEDHRDEDGESQKREMQVREKAGKS